jgi:hypothetical protein
MELRLKQSLGGETPWCQQHFDKGTLGAAQPDSKRDDEAALGRIDKGRGKQIRNGGPKQAF